MAVPSMPTYNLPAALCPHGIEHAWQFAWHTPGLDLPHDLLHAERRAVEDEKCIHVVPRRLKLAGEAGVKVTIAGVCQVQGYLRFVPVSVRCSWALES